MLTRTLRRLLVPADAMRPSRERLSLAQGLERLADDARVRRHRPGTPDPLIDPSVAAACVAPAAAVAARLRDPAIVVDAATLEEVRSFLTDGASSPLFGLDATDALLAASALERRLPPAPPVARRAPG